MARYENGWIKIHRDILDNAVARRDEFTFGVFIRILLMANWKESKVIFGGKKITVSPGQLVTGLRELSPSFDEDPYLHRVRSALSYLALCETIEQATSNQGRLITIRNWDKYQNSESIKLESTAVEEQTVRKHPANPPQLIEEVQEGKKKEEGKKSENHLFESLKKTWLETLRELGCERNLYPFEDAELLTALKRFKSSEAVDQALYGARFEKSFPGFEPKEHASLSRIFSLDRKGNSNIGKFLALAAANKPKEKSYAEQEEFAS